jgi:hypothetical protein
VCRTQYSSKLVVYRQCLFVLSACLNFHSFRYVVETILSDVLEPLSHVTSTISLSRIIFNDKATLAGAVSYRSNDFIVRTATYSCRRSIPCARRRRTWLVNRCSVKYLQINVLTHIVPLPHDVENIVQYLWMFSFETIILRRRRHVCIENKSLVRFVSRQAAVDCISFTNTCVRVTTSFDHCMFK